uniref:Uncharacterized protein n=1 Tax=viral metagenome TaxID=1070528 RepID=A0A6C0D6D7_9ZZZZ
MGVVWKIFIRFIVNKKNLFKYLFILIFMPNISLEFPIYKDDYEIISDEIRSKNILNCGRIHKVRHNLGNDKYALLMIHINNIKKLKIEENIKKFICSGYVVKHWLYLDIDKELFMGKVPIDNSKINTNQLFLRSQYYFVIIEAQNLQQIVRDLNYIDEEIDLR